MIGKTNWKQHLRATRKKEIDIVFSVLPQHFASALEIGAGDGYQATLLAPHMDKLISSDLNLRRLKKSLKVPIVVYKTIDADSMEGVFGDKTFDFIFSSSVLEHLHDPAKFLMATYKILTDYGFAVHIVPSRHLKIFYLVLYYPNLALLVLDRLWGKLRGKPFFRGASINFDNNPNAKANSSSKKDTSRLKRFIFPTPHGNYLSHTQEFSAWSKNKWESLFLDAGYSIHVYIKGPAFSGYGFGWNRVRKLLESCGVSSEHIFILKKNALSKET